MNDYEGLAIDQDLWQFEHQMYWVMPVPSFNQPVHITGVELRTVNGTGEFDAPEAYLIDYTNGGFYQGLKLTYELRAVDLAGSTYETVDKPRLQALDNHLTIVIPVNIHQRGCHEAQLVFRVRTSDGHTHALGSRWYVAVDTGVSRIEGDNKCAGPRPTPASSGPG